MSTHAQFGEGTTNVEAASVLSSRIKGRTFVITGPSTSTVGGETAASLALAHPKHIILVGRSEKKVGPVQQRVAELSPNTKIDFIQTDLSEPSSVLAAASRIKSLTNHIDVLVNNAGIMAVEHFSVNSHGLELHLATNHIGHFLLTAELVPLLIQAGPGSRIINLSSDGYGLSPFRFDDYNFEDGKNYNPWLGYGQSKTANILLTKSLASKLKGYNIQSFAVTPGLVLESHLQDNVRPEMFQAGMALYTKVYGARGKEVPEFSPPKPLSASASTTLVAALDPDLESHSGGYMRDCKLVSDVEEYAADMDQAQRLWELSEKLVGRKYTF